MTTTLGKLSRFLALGLALVLPLGHAQAQEWNAARFFQYNIENVMVTTGLTGWNVRVVFSVTDPTTDTELARQRSWNLKTDAPFTTTGAGLTLDIGWDPSGDFTNTGSENTALTPVVGPALGKGAAIPVQVRNLQGASGAAKPCDAACGSIPSYVGRYYVDKVVLPVAFTTAVVNGRVAIEGKPVCSGIAGYTCATANAAIPVTSVTANFSFYPTSGETALTADPRRQIVDIAKCKQCHDGAQHGDVVVPKLTLHGTNRTENLGLCVVCHNPNQTDVPYRYKTTLATEDPRIAGKETPIDFKVMVHSIHAGGFREQPYVVVGFNSSVNDFSDVRFPRELRDCTNCHVDVGGKGSYELPVKATLGTTVNTRSNYLVPKGDATRSISVNPADDLRISPTAASCSACHDKKEVRDHMMKTGGASFGALQSTISSKVERCVSCHGPGKDRDVRKVHQISGDD